jgi:peptide/nickel transport system substrate-binding protein
MTSSDTPSSLSRRAVLAGAAASTAATAGCIGQLQSALGQSQLSQLTLEIKTLPADSDPFSIRIARHLKSNLEAVGIGARLTVMAVSELSRQVLLNHDFDIYIGQFPHTQPPDPDVLYPLFRSTFDSELGWQNPFGFTHLTCDDLLATQRSSSGETRKQAVTDLQQLLARTQPFTPVVFPELATGVRTDRFGNWDTERPTRPHNLLSLSHTEGEPRTLRLVDVDARITDNRNPISAAYQQEESLLDLVYDSLALNEGSALVPWLARDITWTNGGRHPTASIRLRDGIEWHDGKPLTAYDVGFSYEFLRDTSLGSAVRPIPSERFRGRISLVDDVTVENSRELSLSFTETTQPVAQRALTVPILPAHIWRYRTGIERPVGRAGETTAGLTWNNPSAIGSGPIQFETADSDRVEFSRFEKHFLWRSPTPAPDGTSQTNDAANSTTDTQNQTTGTPESTELSAVENNSSTNKSDRPLNGTDVGGINGVVPRDDFEPPPEAYAVSPPFETISIETVSSDNGAIELLTSGDVDATVTNLSPEAIESIEGPDLELITNQSNAFYHLGFNTRRRPLRNPNVRRLIAQLVDKSMLAEESFGGYGVPAASPLAETDWLVDSLAWDETTATDPEVPFLGTDGEVDVETARERFRSIGYRFTNDNELISQIR